MLSGRLSHDRGFSGAQIGDDLLDTPSLVSRKCHNTANTLSLSGEFVKV